LAVMAILVALVSGFGFWTNHLLEESSVLLLKSVDSVSAELENNHWEQAASLTEKLDNDWEKQKKWWPVILNHQEIDNIDFALGRVKEYVAARDPAMSMGQLSELRIMIRHIPEKEALTLENIL